MFNNFFNVSAKYWLTVLVRDIAEQVFSAAGSIPDSVVGGRLGTAGTVVETARDIADPNTSIVDTVTNFGRGVASGTVGKTVGSAFVIASTAALAAPTIPVVIAGTAITIGVSIVVYYGLEKLESALEQAKSSSENN